MKFSDYKHFMIVSAGTAMMMQMNSNFTISIPEPVEEAPYPNADLSMRGTMIYDVLKTDDYPDGKIHVAVYVDSNLPFTYPDKKEKI